VKNDSGKQGYVNKYVSGSAHSITGYLRQKPYKKLTTEEFTDMNHKYEE
jgi:hypothetical protein